jgi:hypothetical protein
MPVAYVHVLFYTSDIRTNAGINRAMPRISDLLAIVAFAAGLIGLAYGIGDSHPDLSHQLAFHYSLIALVGGFSWLSGLRTLGRRF